MENSLHQPRIQRPTPSHRRGEYFKLKAFRFLLDLCKLEYVRVKSDFAQRGISLVTERHNVRFEARAEYSNTDTTAL